MFTFPVAVSVVLTMWATLSSCQDDDRNRNNSLPISSERRLVTHLLTRYKRYGKEARPRFNSSRKMTVQLGLRLMHLEVDEKEQTMKTSVWKRIQWFDSFLKWNPDDYQGLDNIVLPLKQIWHPDIGLVNTASPSKEEREVEVQVKSNGRVFWAPQSVYNSACLMDLTDYPYDKHTCDMWFQCTALYSHFVDLKPFYKEPMDISTFLDEYKNSTEWEILENSTRRVEKPRDEGVILMYSRRVSMKFSLTIRRRPGFKSLLLMLPCVLLSLLTCVVFSIPPERPDRHMLAMSLFASFMVLLLILTETAPSSAASVPTLAVYYRHNLLLIMSSVFVSVCIVNISKLGEHGRSVPHWVQVLFFHWLSVPLMMRDRVRILNLLHAADSPDKANGTNFNKFPQTEAGHLTSGMGATSSGSGGVSENVACRQCHLAAGVELQLGNLEAVLYHKLRSKFLWEYTSKWRLVAAMLDRMCMCIYLLINVVLIVLFYPVVGW